MKLAMVRSTSEAKLANNGGVIAREHIIDRCDHAVPVKQEIEGNDGHNHKEHHHIDDRHGRGEHGLQKLAAALLDGFADRDQRGAQGAVCVHERGEALCQEIL